MSSHYTTRHHGEPQAKHFRDITLGRLDRFEGYLAPALFEARDGDAVTMSVWHAPGLSKPSFEEATKATDWKPLSKGDVFHGSWTNHWVKLTLRVPPGWQQYERIQLEFDPGCEALVFNTEGLPLQALVGGFGEHRRVEHILTPKARSFPYTIYIEVTCNAMFGLDKFKGDPGYENESYQLNSADLVAPRMEAWHLLWDFRVLKDLAREIDQDKPLQHQSFAAANEIVNIFRQDDLSTIARCRKVAEKVFGNGLKLGPEIYSRPSDLHPQVYAVGNCHIDTAWLWPFSATQQKVARSWATQIDLIERYPEYRFVASQAQQFKWLEQLYPSLFDRVRDKVASGEFQPIGGCWVEMDTNMPSGEALCRQFIYGQRYFKTRFGKLCETFWLPDSFGYASQLPQLARLAGMNNFFTQKLSWSQFNDFPHSTFNWVGMDGTKILTHMPPVNTYTANANARDVKVSISTHKSLEQSDLALLPYGFGDGGAGPTPPFLESLRRLRAAADQSRDLPKTVLTGADDLFRQILVTTNNGENLVDWIGELYLEYHRGTYTSHGSIKNHNRRSEELLHDIEATATLAFLQGGLQENGKKYRYPKDELDALWEDILLCQFHDVLPGSAIEMVYEDAERIYANVASKGAVLLEKAIAALHPVLGVDAANVGVPVGLSTEPGARCEVVPTNNRFVITNGRHVQPYSRDGSFCLMHDQGDGAALLVPENVPIRSATVKNGPKGDLILANELLSVTITKTGRITSILDLEDGREILDTKFTAGFVLYQDRPNNYDAWDIDIFHLETAEQLEGDVQVTSEGPLRASVLLKIKYGQSVISSTISLDATLTSSNKLSLLRFENTVDWHSQHVLLKFQLPLAITADHATYDTQFGVLNRPTHKNTSWDSAKFEVCAHKFADLSEFGYGVALINNNKYGYSTAGNIMRLSLLRGATYPDRHQDQGTHAFNFAIYPHRGTFHASDVPQVARYFNSPFRIRQAPLGFTAAKAPIKVEGTPNLVLGTIKRGDDDDYSSKATEQSVILRLYDAYGGAAKGTVSFDFPVEKAAVTDLLEREIRPIKVKHAGGFSAYHSFEVALRPFEVQTIKLWLAPFEKEDWVQA